MADTASEVAAKPTGTTTSTPPATKAKDGSTERPIVTRSGDSKPVFEADGDKLAAQSTGNSPQIAKPAPTPTHSTAVNMLLTSWSEMKMKFADFDHDLDMDDPVEAELQAVIDFLRDRT